MKIKVLHVYKTFLPETVGGVENAVYNMCRGTFKHGVQAKVLCLSQESTSATKVGGVSITRYKYDIKIASTPISLRLLFAFRREAKWADIVHYHYPWPFGDLLSLLVPKGKKQVVTYHSDIVKQKFWRMLYYPLEQWFLSKVDKIIATSPNYIHVSKNLRKFQQKVQVIPLVINHKSYPVPDGRKCKTIKKKFGSKFILFIGQLRYYKGLHLLISAMKNVPTNLVIIGQGSGEKRLIRICRKNNINNVHFIGAATEEEKVNYLDACYALTLPSHLKSEAFGIALLEGAMFGKPLISCRIGTGVEYVNEHSETGLVVKPTSDEIKKAILYLIDNPKQARLMGSKARDRFLKVFHYDKACKMLALLYKASV